MALIFGVVAPFVFLGVASILYLKTTWPTLHVPLLIVVTVPAVVLAGTVDSGSTDGSGHRPRRVSL